MKLSERDQAGTVASSALGGAVGAKMVHPTVVGAAGGAAVGTVGGLAAMSHKKQIKAVADKVQTKYQGRTENKHPNLRGY